MPVCTYKFTSKAGNVFFIRCRPATASRVQLAYELEFEFRLEPAAVEPPALLPSSGTARPSASEPARARAVA
jgi:hypothetical protein